MKRTKLIGGVLAALFIIGALFTSAVLLKSNDVKADDGVQVKTTAPAGACGCGCGGACGGKCGVEGCSCGKGP